MKIVFVGLSGVPYSGRACDSRLANIANLLSENATVEIFNRYSSQKKEALSGIKLSDKVVSVELIKSRMTKGLSTLLLYILSLLKEPFFIIKSHQKEKIDWLHLYTGHYIDFVVYRFISRIIGAKIVYEYVEYRSEKPAKGIYHRVNNWLCDFHGAKIWDACIVISNYLSDRALQVNQNLPIIKVTPIGDFELFDSIGNDVDIAEEYIMFCGHAGYFDVVKLIIDSYCCSQIRHAMKLLLVLGGNEQQIDKVKEYYPDAIVKSKLSYQKLIAYYKHAYILMIPLRDSIEDIARFPNKICEYTAAHGFIVTTNNGEMKYYFKNGVNAIVADDCTVEAIAGRLDEIVNGVYDISSIKECSYNTGIKNFSKDYYRTILYQFLLEHR